MLANNQKIKVRFYGIDAPEKAQPYGLEAKEFVMSRIKDKEITVEVQDTDRYKRKIGKIYYDSGTYLNEEIVANGYAWWYQYYAKSDFDLKEAEKDARAKKLGLWNESSPQAPWEYRKQKRESGGVKKVAPVATNSSGLVYVTKTGKKYNKKGCKYLKSIKDSYTREEAEKIGYTSCSYF